MSNNWIDDLVAECGHVETPKSWLWWSFVSAISAVAANNYYVVTLKGDLIYKSNMYIILLGESGLGKGFPINRAKMLVQQADVTRVIAGRSSIQAIVKEMATTRSKNGKAPIMDSRCFIVNGELSSAIIQDADALTILTDLYDGNYNKVWANLLKGDGEEKLKDPYITALFGSSPAHFYDSIPQANIEGGYIGRNLIIYEEKRSQNIDLFDGDDSDEGSVDKFDSYIVPKYVPHLESIASKKGRLILTTAARLYFNDWRKEWRATQPVTEKTGFLNRVPDHSIKVAMCICLSRYDNRGIIEEDDIITAIKKVTSLVYANKRTTEGKGLDPNAAQTKMILDFLLRADEFTLSRKLLLSKGYGSYDAVTLDRIIETLLEMGWCQKERHVAGKSSDWLIKLAGEPLESYRRYLKSQVVSK